jgi:MFS transporter, PAT family, beta-lactamase induction signal transducer AmpG
VRPYIESAPLAALFLGISSGAAFAMIGATLTTRRAQYGIKKSAVTMFALTFLAYNFKFLWAAASRQHCSVSMSRIGRTMFNVRLRQTRVAN